MASFVNHVAIAAPRNGTTTHAVSPSTGTVATGTLFTPTAGRLLVVVVEGAVTSNTPTGWTLPSGGFAVNNSGLYVWWRVAAGADTFTVTQGTTNYPLVFDFYEFASGSTFVSSAAATAVSYNGGAGPSLTGLTGSNWIAGAFGQDNNAATTGTVTWDVGVKAVDTSVPFATTDGYTYSLTYLADSTLTTASPTATGQSPAGGLASTERLVFAVNAAGGAAAAPFRRPQIVRQAVNRAGSF